MQLSQFNSTVTQIKCFFLPTKLFQNNCLCMYVCVYVHILTYFLLSCIKKRLIMHLHQQQHFTVKCWMTERASLLSLKFHAMNQ